MDMTHFSFFLCLVPFIALIRNLRDSKLRCRWILVAGLSFYALSEGRFLLLLLGTTGMDYAIAVKLRASLSSTRRRLLLWLSILINAGLLLSFKFLLSTQSITTIPIGMSFYVFQSLAYVIDHYRDPHGKHVSWWDFLTAITFFPHLFAGPIVKAQEIIEQLKRPLEKLNWMTLQQSIWWILCGLLKKKLADQVAFIVELSFFEGETSAARALLSSLAFVAQIYGDFSGYTDIARGSATLLGVNLPVNFRLPFLAKSPADYYAHRWHISLANWIREYLFLPLALFFQRHWRLGHALAILVTMSAMGLWHGLGLTYLLWGQYVGALIVLSHVFWKKLWFHRFPWLGIIFTFYLITLGLVIFRSTSLVMASDMLSALHTGTFEWSLFLNHLDSVLIALASLQLLAFFTDYWMPRNRPLWSLLALILCYAISSLHPTQKAFIYFNF